MPPVNLRVEEMVVEADTGMLPSATVERMLRDAFMELGRLLARTPHARWIDHKKLVHDTLELEPISVDELLGPQGAQRLAEHMYERLEGSWS